MIALDELPASVRLMGVPVTMTLAEAFQAHLQSVGNEPKADGTRYQLEPSSVKTTSDTDAEEDYSGSDSSSGQKTFVAPDKKASEKGIVNWRQGPKDRAQVLL